MYNEDYYDPFIEDLADEAFEEAESWYREFLLFQDGFFQDLSNMWDDVATVFENL